MFKTKIKIIEILVKALNDLKYQNFNDPVLRELYFIKIRKALDVLEKKCK